MYSKELKRKAASAKRESIMGKKQNGKQTSRFGRDNVNSLTTEIRAIFTAFPRTRGDVKVDNIRPESYCFPITAQWITIPTLIIHDWRQVKMYFVIAAIMSEIVNNNTATILEIFMQ